MTDGDVQGLKLAVQEATARGQQQMWLSVALAGKLCAELEGRLEAQRRLLIAVETALSAIAKWRSGELDAVTAMQVIVAATGTWQAGRS